MSDSCSLLSEDLLNGSGELRGAWWIDDEANWRHVKAETDQPHLSDPAAASLEVLSYFYSWLGMVRIDVSATETTIEWDVQNALPASLEQAKTFLAHCSKPRNVILNYCYGGWSRERFGSVSSALERLRETESYRHVAPFEGPRIHPIDLQRLDREQLQQPMRQALHIWDSWRIEPERGLTAFFDAPELLEHMIIYRRSETGELVYARIGEASLFAQAYGLPQTSGLIGYNCALDPDHPTPQNPICEAYETVLGSGSPRYDRLRAIYCRDAMRYWISCERLLLPFTISMDEEFLISVCCALDTLAIPTREGHRSLDPEFAGTRTA